MRDHRTPQCNRDISPKTARFNSIVKIRHCATRMRIGGNTGNRLGLPSGPARPGGISATPRFPAPETRMAALWAQTRSVYL
jgi:hypothetical protein